MNDSSLQDIYTLQIRRQANPHSASPYCEACKNGFLHVNSLQVRQFTQTGKLPGVCKSCNNAFMKICRLQIRHLTQNEPQPHVCAVCSKSFTHAGNYRKHTLLHKKEEEKNGANLQNGTVNPGIPKPPYNCDKCGRNFLKYGSFIKHRQSHDIIKTFVCDICEKSFKSKPVLKAHMRTHKIGPTHACKLCKELFTVPEELEEHLVKHLEDQASSVKQEATNSSKGDPDKSLPEESVDESLNQNSLATPKEESEELQDTTEEEKFKHYCSVCKKGFVNLGALKNHFAMHTGNLAFKCKKCNRKFMHGFNLKQHAKSHLKRPHGCKKCKKSFKTRKLLKEHSAIHNKKKSTH